MARIAYAILLVSPLCFAQETIKLSEQAWLGLSSTERALIQASKTVELKAAGTFGTVIDNQGVNESTAANSSGSVIGGAVAEAAYIDKAIRDGNYSAKQHLATGILGALLGSALNKPAVPQFHYRYALKLSNGDIQYHDSVQSTAFRHPAGMCLSIPDLTPIAQSICTDTTADIRAKYLPAQQILGQQAPEAPAGRAAPSIGVSAGAQVPCRLPNLPAVLTTADKCQSIGGLTQ